MEAHLDGDLHLYGFAILCSRLESPLLYGVHGGGVFFAGESAQNVEIGRQAVRSDDGGYLNDAVHESFVGRIGKFGLDVVSQLGCFYIRSRFINDVLLFCAGCFIGTRSLKKADEQKAGYR